jgi:hypothetical protein
VVGVLEEGSEGAVKRHQHTRSDLVRQAQKPFEPATRVLRPLAVVAVRQQQHQPRLAKPLGLPGSQELIDDDLQRGCRVKRIVCGDLGAVHEVAELGFPDHEGLGAFERKPELKAHHT